MSTHIEPTEQHHARRNGTSLRYGYLVICVVSARYRSATAATVIAQSPPLPAYEVSYDLCCSSVVRLRAIRGESPLHPRQNDICNLCIGPATCKCPVIIDHAVATSICSF